MTTTTFTAAQIKRASVPGRGERVATITFGELSQFAALLVRTRMGEPHVLIADANRADEVTGGPLVVWQGAPADLPRAQAAVIAHQEARS